jgi:uncharacterized protein
MIHLFIDADGCPVKNQAYHVAKRYQLPVYVVSNSWLKMPKEELIELVIVNDQFDAADDWIVDRIERNDIVVTGDIPLASRCLQKAARAIDPKGRVFDQDSIGNALANRELAAFMRELGEKTGGPAPFQNADRSRFLQNFDNLIQAALREEKTLKNL